MNCVVVHQVHTGWRILVLGSFFVCLFVCLFVLIYFLITGSEEEDEELFSWEEYLKKCHAKAVPKETFKHVSTCTYTCTCFPLFDHRTILTVLILAVCKTDVTKHRIN